MTQTQQTQQTATQIINSTDEALMGAYELHRRNANGEAVGLDDGRERLAEHHLIMDERAVHDHAHGLALQLHQELDVYFCSNLCVSTQSPSTATICGRKVTY